MRRPALLVEMQMRMLVRAVAMEMEVVVSGEAFANRADTEKDQDDGDSQFEGPLEPRGDAHTQHNQHAPGHKDRKQMTESPGGSNQCTAARTRGVAEHCADGGDVVGLGGMFQAQCET